MPAAPTPPIWDIRFGGQATVAGHSLTAVIYLSEGNKSVAALEAIPSIQLSALFNHFFGPAVPWPDSVIDLTLTDGQVFYRFSDPAKPASPAALPGNLAALSPTLAPAAQATTAAGLYVAADVQLSIADHALPKAVVQIGFVGSNGSTGDKGVTATVTLKDPVDLLGLGALSLSGPKFSGGPTLSLVSKVSTKSCLLHCAFTLFQEQFADSDVVVTVDTATTVRPAAAGAAAGAATRLDTKLTYAGTWAAFQNAKLHVTWSRAEGLRIVDFPNLLVALPATLKLGEELKKISGRAGNNCASFVGLAFNEVVQTKVRVTPSVSAGNGGLTASLEGTFSVVIGGRNVADIQLPTLSFAVKAPRTYTLRGIVGDIAQCIVDNAEQVVGALWNDKAQLGAVLAVMVGQQALRTAAQRAACALLDELLDALVDALGGVAVGDVGGALAAAAAAAATLDLIGKLPAGAAHRLATPAITVAFTAASAAANTGANAAASSSSIGITWSSITGAAGYEVLLRQRVTAAGGARPTFTVLKVLTLPRTATAASFPLDAAAKLPDAFDVRVRALADGSGESLDSATATATLSTLAKPATVSLAYDAAQDQLTARWAPVAQATSYRVQPGRLVNGALAPTSAPLTVAAPTTAQVFRVADFASTATGDCTVNVRAQAAPGFVTSDAAVAAAVPVQDPPATVRLGWDNATTSLQVFWVPVTMADGLAHAGPVTFAVRLYDAGGTQVVGEVPNAANAGVPITLKSGVPFVPGQTYRAAVAVVVAGRQAGPFSPPSAPFTVAAVPAPPGIAVSIDGGNVMVSWQPVAMPAGSSGAPYYEVELASTAQPATAVARTFPAVSGTTATLSSGSQLVPGEHYVARVRAIVGTSSGAWGTSDPIVALGIPVVTSLSYDAPAVIVRWQAVANADAYEVSLRDGSDQLLAPPVSAIVTLTAGQPLEVRLPGSFYDGNVITALIRARQGSHNIGPMSSPALQPAARFTIHLAPPPTDGDLRWDADRHALQAYWTDAPLTGAFAGAGPVTYNVRMLDNTGTQVVGEAFGVAPGVVLALKSGARITAGQTYRVDIAVVVAGLQAGPFGRPTPPFGILSLQGPAGVTVTVDGGIVLVSWQPVAVPAGWSGPCLYTAELVPTAQPGTAVARTVPVVSGTSTELANKGGPPIMVPGQHYFVRVRASLGKYDGAWASSDSFVALGVPVVTSMSYDAPAVVVRWQAVANADAYEVVVRNSFGAPLNPSLSTVVRPTAGQPLEARLAGRFSDGQIVTTIIRALQGSGNVGAWSDLPPAAPTRMTIRVGH